MEITGIYKGQYEWFVSMDNGAMRIIRHDIKTAAENPITPDEFFMCLLLEELHQQSLTSDR